MKTFPAWARLLILLAGPTSLSFGQAVIENPAKPRAANAGRVLALTQVWHITDEAGAFYFKYPNQLQAADDSTVFVADEDQLLRFSPEGTFLKNVGRKGQGPGEIGGYFAYFVRGRDLFIQDMNSQRFWRADFDGVFQEAINLANKDYRGFLGVLPDGFLFLKTVWPPFNERTGKPMEIPHIVARVARDGSEIKEVATFRPKDFLGPESAMSLTAKITALSPDGKLLYALHGRDYLIEVVDVEAAKIVRRFGRAYPKVPHIENEGEASFRKKYGSPRLEYEIDVRNLYPVGDLLWVETSTNDQAKGRLIDVFDHEGHFIDNFYLGAGRALMAAQESAVYCQEKGEDESIRVVKYRIER